MDINEIQSLADAGKEGFDTGADVDVSRLEKFASEFRSLIDQARAADPKAVQKTDADIVDEVGTAIESRVGFSVQEAATSYHKVFVDLVNKSVVSALPLMLRLRGRPYTLDDHFPMEPLFRTELPIRLLLRCARQVSKSTSLAAQGVIQAGCVPYFNSLFVTPLFEQCRRFSSNYVRPFVLESPLNRALVDAKCNQSVLQRSFRNQSHMFFSYCLKDADRVRGIAADRVVADEIQDISWDLLPIILETMSASKWAVLQAAGTPKTLDNTIEFLWNQSSQAEWITRCEACNHYNIAAIAHDLLRMIGEKTVVCAKCAKPINPRPAFHPNSRARGTGFWCHAWPDKAAEFPGYHAPQVIFPMHFDNPRKWFILRQKMNPAHTPRHLFVNEVLGEGADAGTKLLTHGDVMRACQIYGKVNKYLDAMKIKERYADIAIGVDWGGSTSPYGAGRAHLLLKPEEAQSYTVLSVVGLKAGGQIDVIYLYRFSLSNHIEESKACLSAWTEVDGGHGSTLFCHDYGGAGTVRETLLIQSGLPVENVLSLMYLHAPQQRMMEPKAKGSRLYYQLDKARSLLFLCQCIKVGMVGFPSYETFKPFEADFLALMEDLIERPGAADIMRVVRKPGIPDDAAHAVNFAACGLWQRHGFPNLKEHIGLYSALQQMDKSAQAVKDDENALEFS